MKEGILISILSIILLLASISANINIGYNAEAQTIPVLQVEHSASAGLNHTYNSIQTIDTQNGYKDVMAGALTFTSPGYNAGDRAFYAANYENGQLTWVKSVYILNTTTYVNSSFNDVSNYIFTGRVWGQLESSTLIMKLNSTDGAMECYTIVRPGGGHWLTEGNAIGLNPNTTLYTIVGASNPHDNLVEFSTSNYPSLIDVNGTNCNTTGHYTIGSIPGAFTDIKIIDDSNNPYYGYKLISGYEALYNQTTSTIRINPIIVVLDQSNNVVVGRALDFGVDAYASSITFLNDKIIVGGTEYSNNNTDGFITILNSNLTADATYRLVGQADEAINSITTRGASTIVYTGTLNSAPQAGQAIVGLINASSPADNKTYAYQTSQSEGYDVSVGGQGLIHVAGQLRGPFPNNIVELTQPVLYTAVNPTITQYPVLFKNYPVIEENLSMNVFNAWPVQDQSNSINIHALYFVLGFETVIEPPTTTTTQINITQTTTQPPTVTVTYNTTTTATSIHSIIPPGCIDISTGTDIYGYSQAYGSVEDYVSDYPDWAIVQPGNLTPIVAYSSAWNEMSSPARWITPYSDNQGNPIRVNPGNSHYPPTTYQLTVTLQAPSTMSMDWMSDNNGSLYIDGVLVQQSSPLLTPSTYNTGLPPGTHTIKIVVSDQGVITGLFVHGKICSTTLTTATIGRPTTTTSQTTTGGGGNGTTGTPCPCGGVITYAAGGVAALFTVGWIITYALVRRK